MKLKVGKAPKRDLTGKRFHDWEILCYSGRTERGVAVYKARCSCGKIENRNGSDIERGKSKRCKSCGVVERYRKEPNTYVGPDSPNWKGSKDIPRAQFTKFQYGAKSRDIEFTLTIEDLQKLWEVQEGKCAYTGRELVFNNKSFKSKKYKGTAYNFASLDRIDSNKGYVEGNVQWVTQAINIAKQSYFHEEFLALVRDICTHMNLLDK